ncbi:MAG TPA: GTP-binding protein [Agitococcus sp.]|nr:GTP-binding protein [Agitococcus sp.]
MQPILSAIPTNIVTGFLGAGKTTLIQQLLANKPTNERWAVLVNEFGQIGIDHALMGQSQEVFIKEVAGGCICCANFLPMQVALSQLLAKAKPQRLLIEPTGLGHPKQIIESLSASHWQSTLKLEATLCVIDARQYQDERVQQHESFIAQAQVADVLVFSKSELLTESERDSVIEFSQKLPEPKPQSVFIEQGNLALSYLSYKRQHAPIIKRSLLHDNARLSFSQHTPQQEVIEPPYHYHQQALDCFVGGWIFPAHWQFEHNALLEMLLALQAQRIKGVVHTTQGWLSINLTALDASFNSCPPSLDSRLEIISQQEITWQHFEESLMLVAHR